MALDDQQRWYRMFQEGTFLVKGWQARSLEILEQVPAGEREAMAQLLDRLGEKIGGEWATESRSRRIDTAMLVRWGEALRRASREGAERLIREIRRIDEKVDRVLAPPPRPDIHT